MTTIFKLVNAMLILAESLYDFPLSRLVYVQTSAHSSVMRLISGQAPNRNGKSELRGAHCCKPHPVGSGVVV